VKLSKLPDHHNDPFDRILIAQARLERMTILTADRQIERDSVKAIRADGSPPAGLGPGGAISDGSQSKN
jgi:hypothetical protein